MKKLLLVSSSSFARRVTPGGPAVEMTRQSYLFWQGGRDEWDWKYVREHLTSNKHKVCISEHTRAVLKMTRLWLIKLKSCLFHVQLQPFIYLLYSFLGWGIWVEVFFSSVAARQSSVSLSRSYIGNWQPGDHMLDWLKNALDKVCIGRIRYSFMTVHIYWYKVN